MKRPFTLIILLGIILTTAAQSPDEKDVAVAVETLRQAMIDANKAVLLDLSADALSYGHSSGTIEDKGAFVDAIASGKSDFVTIAISEQTISIAGSNAIVRHKLAGTTNNNGTPGTLNISVLLVWQKQNGKWKLLARQAFRLPT